MVNSLPLKQFGVNFGLLPNNRVRIQKLGTFRALGFGQIPQGAEIANGVLLKKPSGFYLHLTVYVPRDGSEKRTPAHPSGADKTGFGPVRLDLGVKYPLTLSNGLRFEYQIPPSRRLIRNRLDPFLFWWSTPKALLFEADIPDELLLTLSGTLQEGFLSNGYSAGSPGSGSAQRTAPTPAAPFGGNTSGW